MVRYGSLPCSRIAQENPEVLARSEFLRHLCHAFGLGENCEIHVAHATSSSQTPANSPEDTLSKDRFRSWMPSQSLQSRATRDWDLQSMKSLGAANSSQIRTTPTTTPSWWCWGNRTTLHLYQCQVLLKPFCPQVAFLKLHCNNVHHVSSLIIRSTSTCGFYFTGGCNSIHRKTKTSLPAMLRMLPQIAAGSICEIASDCIIIIYDYHNIWYNHDISWYINVINSFELLLDRQVLELLLHPAPGPRKMLQLPAAARTTAWLARLMALRFRCFQKASEKQSARGISCL